MSYFSLADENDDDGGSFDPQGPMSRGGGGGLNSLFGLNKNMHNTSSTNQSLQYKPPKPPKAETTTQQEADVSEKQPSKPQPKSAPSVILAAAVNAFKLVNGQYTSHGKLGAALLASHDAKDYKIFMYVTKQQPVTTATIKENFAFNVLANDNNYATFTDDLQQSWSISFDTKEKLIEYAKQICLCKFLCNPQTVVIQDLSVGETTQQLSNGDSVEVKYTGWLVTNNQLGKVFDTNNNSDKTFRLKLGKGKVIKGWEIGMTGMMKKGKRFIVIPPSFAYGQKSVGDRVPSNSTLAFEVDVLRIKYVNEVKPEPEPVTVSPKSETVPATVQPSTSELTVKDRAASLDEHSIHPSASEDDKTKLLSRMAKMGHAMLPQQPAPVVPHVEDVSPQSVHSVHSVHSGHVQSVQSSTPRQSPAPQTHPVAMAHSPVQYMNTSPDVTPVYGAPLVHQTQHPTVMLRSPIQQPAAYHPQPQTFPSNSTYAGDFAAVLLNETRQQSNEIKDIQTKLDKVFDKVDEVKEISIRNDSSKLSNYAMDANMISHSIQRILTENATLKSQVETKDKQIEKQTNKISELMEQNQRYMEKSHKILEQNRDSFQQSLGKNEALNQQHEQEKMKMMREMRESRDEVASLRATVEEMKEAEKQLRRKLHQAEDDVKKKQTASEDNQGLQEQLANEKNKSDKTMKDFEGQKLSWKKEEEELHEKIQQMKMENQTLTNEVERLKMMSKQNETADADVLRQLATAEEKYTTLKTAKDDEVQQLNNKLEVIHKKFLQLREMYMKTKEHETELESKVEEADVYQQRYERLREQASSMKQKYEGRIRELMQEKEEESEKKTGGDVVAKVKTIMNTMFVSIRGKVDKETEYSGSQVLSLVLSVIKSTTMNMMEEESAKEDHQEEGDDQEEEEEHQEEEDEVVKSASAEDDVTRSVADVQTSSNVQEDEEDESHGQNVKGSTNEEPPIATEVEEDVSESNEATSEDNHPVKVDTAENNTDVTVKTSANDSEDQEQNISRSLSDGSTSPASLDDSEQPPPLDNVDSEDDGDWLK